MSLKPLLSDVYVGASTVGLTYRETRRQIGCGLARWLWRCQNNPYTANKSGSSPGENFHNISCGTGPSAVALKALLWLEKEAEPGFGSGSGSLNRLS